VTVPENVLESNQPLISVIIPIYNGEAYLAEAIDSVLAQDYRRLEVIIVDDGSNDGSPAIAKRYALAKYCRQEHSGLGTALNRGIQAASGELLAFLDADDLWAKDKLSRQLAALTKNSGLDAVFGQVKPFFSPEMHARMRRQPKEKITIIPGYAKGAMLVKREFLFRVGWFATMWKVGDFIDWYARAQELGLRSMMLPDVVLYRRLHSDNMGIRAAGNGSDYVRIVKAALDRRRNKP
jgi:glycosyltransferase involved in cell wall biosynthesis